MKIAIDGPAGAGKTTTAKALAKKLNFMYVDTGAMYRAIALYLVHNHIAIDECNTEVLNKIAISLDGGYGGEAQKVYLNGEDVSADIRTQQISKVASDASALPQVRNFLLEQQRSLARENNVVMEGRDIGTVVLPDADVKFYLTADILCRAQRRFADERAKGRTPVPAEIVAQMQERDHNDMTRNEAPLVIAHDAIIVDNTNIMAHETVNVMAAIISGRMSC